MKEAAFAVLFAVLALIGGALLAAAEFSTLYKVVVDSLEIARALAAALVVLGAVALAVALAGDARSATAHYLEIAGGGLLLLAGAGLLVARTASSVRAARLSMCAG